jgi:hypothetical protein
VEAIAILAVLHVADEAIDPGNRLGRTGHGIEAQFRLQPKRLRLAPDRLDQPVAPRRIEADGAGKLVEQGLQRVQPSAPCARRSGGGRWPSVTAPIRRRPARLLPDR